jgi:hypothetical protein
MRESVPHHCCRMLLRGSLFLSRVGWQWALPCFPLALTCPPSTSSFLLACARHCGRGHHCRRCKLPYGTVVPLRWTSSSPESTTIGAAAAASHCLYGRLASDPRGARQGHQQVRGDPLVLPHPSAVADESPTAGFSELRRPLLCKSRPRALGNNSRKDEGLNAMSLTQMNSGIRIVLWWFCRNFGNS